MPPKQRAQPTTASPTVDLSELSRLELRTLPCAAIPPGNPDGALEIRLPAAPAYKHHDLDARNTILADEFLADDLTPPPEARHWPDALLHLWFENGGRLLSDRASAARLNALSAVGAVNLDRLYATLPRRRLPLTTDSPLLQAIASADDEPIRAVARALRERGYARCRLGVSAGSWARVVAEGGAAYPFMRPGELSGSGAAGVSPAGTPRGDRFLVVHERAMPAVEALSHAVATVAAALGAQLAAEMRLQLVQRSESLFACFRGRGGEYGAHFDGGAGAADGRRLTMVAYANYPWPTEGGGELLLLDEVGGEDGSPCWRAIEPTADTLAIFASDRVLHRVAPTYAPRYALTTFVYGHDLGSKAVWQDMSVGTGG